MKRFKIVAWGRLIGAIGIHYARTFIYTGDRKPDAETADEWLLSRGFIAWSNPVIWEIP